MQLNRETIIDKLRQIKPHLQARYNLTELALFGSYARNEQRPQSDIDIMVKLENISYRNLCDTAYTLYDLFPGHTVQVVSKGAIKPRYFAHVEHDLIYA